MWRFITTVLMFLHCSLFMSIVAHTNKRFIYLTKTVSVEKSRNHDHFVNSARLVYVKILRNR